MAVRNPLVALFMTLFETAIFAPLLCIPLLLFPQFALPAEFPLFWGVAAFAVAGWASAKRHVATVRAEVKLENDEKRRCKMCGVRVGLWAKKCWSCRASLAR